MRILFGHATGTQLGVGGWTSAMDIPSPGRGHIGAGHAVDDYAIPGRRVGKKGCGRAAVIAPLLTVEAAPSRAGVPAGR
jgi:hypothetical protein